MIRKIYPLLMIALLAFSAPMFHSCNYLDIDQYITDMQSLDSVFQKKETTEKFLYNTYNYIASPGSNWSPSPLASPWVSCSDEAFATLPEAHNDYANNIFNATRSEFSTWKHYYAGIRSASIFLMRVPECKELTSIQLREYTGEALFLKAYFYFELMKQYGPVCIAPESGFQLDQPIDEILIPRSAWDECSDYVAGLLTEAAQYLPAERPSSEFGKPTSGAANAVLSRLLLYSASRLYNGNTSYADFIDKKTRQPYINQIYDEGKWAKAASAAWKVINSEKYELNTVAKGSTTLELPERVTSDEDYYKPYPTGAAGIDHYLSYANLFNGSITASDNHEIIFGLPRMGIVQSLGPLKMRGYSEFNIPQKLVNAYYMVNGKTIEEGTSDPDYPYGTEKLGSDKLFSGYRLSAGVYGWYLNREMRFYATVGFNNSYYWGTSAVQSKMKNFKSQFFKGGNCTYEIAGDFTDATARYCMTGYLCRKYQHPEDVFSGAYYGAEKYKVWIEYRLAEIYLNYIEALNELNDSYPIDGVTFSRDPNQIKKYFNLIRHRAGLPGITLNDAQNKETVEALIRSERQIELAWEGRRFFDVRRWKIANIEENGNVTGMAVNKKENEGFYREVQVREVNYAYKNFTMRKNFWPIPQTEITKNTSLVQNPGWE